MVMIRVNIHDAKTHLSKYLSQLKDEKKIFLCRHNVPVAEIVPIENERGKEKRPRGLAQGEFSVPDSFFDELPEDIIHSFYPD
jgi:antitoxin (DNA-binding transcriptional repressor) of toxin-antitoxin stability system